MEQQAILALGTFTLLACGAGFVSIHSSNRLLRGLNWMGWALVAGGTAAGIFLTGFYWQAVLPLGNFSLVLAFALCYRADQALIGETQRQSRISIVLLALVALMAPLQWLHLIGSRVSILVLSLLVSVQLEATARLLTRAATAGTRLPTRFTAGLMRFLSGANLLRGCLAGAGVLAMPVWGYRFETGAMSIFIGAAIWLGFCFFWRATAKLTEEFEHMASTDPLTRVFNRRVFLNWCDKELLRSQASGLPVSVLLIDFDHFKRINDTFGHHFGDEALCSAVERIQDSIRGIDVLCRWGGEEFAVLLPNASPDATLLVAERVRQNVRAVHAFATRQGQHLPAGLHLSVSIGATNFEHGQDTIEAMLQRADAALYQAKHAGRDRVVVAAPGGAGNLAAEAEETSYSWKGALPPTVNSAVEV